MQLCTNCAAEIIPGAKFCHRCGDKFIEKTKPCPACHGLSSVASVFCHHCGFHFEGKSSKQTVYEPVYPLDFDPETITDQVKALFFRSLRMRVSEEHNVARYSDYVERFYQSRFRDIYSVRAEQIAEDSLIQWERFGQEAFPDIDRRISAAFEGLLDYFIIQFCPDLNGVILPTAILKYEKVQPGKTDQRAMIHDFLDFEREEDCFTSTLLQCRKNCWKTCASSSCSPTGRRRSGLSATCR
ncbi:MAG: zinc ribbon domain-containing protein [Lewinellaceae bacterium]|nr:zinc ribbon domain-containing protein [Lewinellaceae bacterium]